MFANSFVGEDPNREFRIALWKVVLDEPHESVESVMFEELLTSAEQGDGQAQLMLGSLYRTGHVFQQQQQWPFQQKLE